MASTKWCKPAEAKIYDALFSKLDSEGQAIVKYLGSNSQIVYMGKRTKAKWIKGLWLVGHSHYDPLSPSGI